MFIADYMMISSEMNLVGEVAEGELRLYVKNDTIRGILESGRLEEIRTAASELVGAPVPVRVLPFAQKNESRFDKLDQLIDRFQL